MSRSGNRQFFMSLLVVAIGAITTAPLPAQPRGRFVNARKVPGAQLHSPEQDFMPTLSADGRTLLFVSFRAGSVGHDYGSDIYMATREAAEDGEGNPVPFGPVSQIDPPGGVDSAVNTVYDDWAPVLTPDGLILIFTSWDPDVGSTQLYLVTRERAFTDTGDPLPFDNRMELESLNTDEAGEFGGSFDGDMNFYFSRGDNPPQPAHDVYVARFFRDSLRFGTPEKLCGTIQSPAEEAFPAVSADGLVIFWSEITGDRIRPGGLGGADIWMARRDSVDDCFGGVTNTAGPLAGINSGRNHYSPWLSPDWPAAGSKLVYGWNPEGGPMDLYELTWESLEEPRVFRRGDVNDDGLYDITDPIVNVGYQFLNDPVSLPCLDAADFDDTGALELTDAILSLEHQFLGGPPPPAPGAETCGVDPTEELLLDCEEYTSCEDPS